MASPQGRHFYFKDLLTLSGKGHIFVVLIFNNKEVNKMKGILLIVFLLVCSIVYSQQDSISYAAKTYHIIKIGNQSWLKENLSVGTQILGKQVMKNDGIIEKYCYNDSSTNCDKYGGLYSWNEAMKYTNKEGNQGICPTGYHIPSKAEVKKLITSANNSGNALKAKGQAGGTNATGFSALLTGYQYDTYNYFNGVGKNTAISTSTENNSNYATALTLSYTDDAYAQDMLMSKSYGYSIRCIKDSVTVGVKSENDISTNYSLSQNYPNPFNGSTLIKYSIKASGNVSIKVYDTLGREISTLINEYKNIGNYSINFNSSNLSSGTYFYTIKTGDFSQTKKMTYLK